MKKLFVVYQNVLWLIKEEMDILLFFHSGPGSNGDIANVFKRLYFLS